MDGDDGESPVPEPEQASVHFITFYTQTSSTEASHDDAFSHWSSHAQSGL